MLKVSRYHPVLVALHWLLALLIVAALVLGALVMVKIPNSDPMKLEALRSHMGGGTLILLLMLVRLFVRTRTTHPATASTGNPTLDRLAWASHRLFYVAVLGMAGSGIFMAIQTGLPRIVFEGGGALPADFWVFPVRTVHYVFSRLLMALIALHVAGALYHTLVLRDGLLRRMFFGHRVLGLNGSAPVHELLGAGASIRPAPELGRARSDSAMASMKGFWKLAPWLSRLIILAVASLFTMISLKFVLDPQQAAANSGIIIEPGLGYTNTRAGFGGFPLGFAVILVFCLFSSRRLLAALSSIVTVAAVISAVRLFGAAHDSTVGQSAHILIPEVVILVISLLGVVMERTRRAHLIAAS